MSEQQLRDALVRATTPPPLTDPLSGVRRRLRRRRLLGAGGGMATVAVVSFAAALWWAEAGMGSPEPYSRQPAADAGTPSVGPSASLTPKKPIRTGDGRAPTPMDPDSTPGVVAVGSLVTAHPDDFTGTYIDESGAVVAVYGPDANEATWRQRLEQAAAGHPLRTARCPASATALLKVQEQLRSFDWPSGRPAYGAFIDPARCAVVMQLKSLPAADVQALEQRFGSAVKVDEGHEPRRR